MMNNNKDMPKVQVVKDEKTVKKYGGTNPVSAHLIIQRLG